MSFDKKRMLALIHLAKKQCGLDDDAYRGLLSGAAGVESAKEISTVAQYNEVMRVFAKLGFKQQSTKRLSPQPEQANALISLRRLYYIKGLWELASRDKSEEGLRHFVKRIAHVDDLRFLDARGATAVTLALKDIARKAGFDPDKPRGAA